jgi:predicted site-specific integrase-resolvase
MDAHLNEHTLAKRWSISPRTLQRWRQEGKGPAYLKLGGRIAYRLVDVEAWEQEQRRGGTPAPATARGAAHGS